MVRNLNWLPFPDKLQVAAEALLEFLACHSQHGTYIITEVARGPLHPKWY